MVKLKYQFTTWAERKYYCVFANGRKLAINVIKSPKDRFGNREIEVQATSAEMDEIMHDINPNHSRGGFTLCFGMEECHKLLEQIAEKVA